jgi:Lipocalin-like domain
MKHYIPGTVAALAALCLVNWSAEAAEAVSGLVGTWQITNYSVLFLDTNESVRTMGEHPTGYIQYSPGGHMVVFLAAEDRKSPVGSAPTDAEAARLYRTIFGAYAGTYTVDGNKLTHHIVTAWAPQRNGDDQIRYFELAGKSLIIKTAPLKDVTSGRPAVPTLVFERIE